MAATARVELQKRKGFLKRILKIAPTFGSGEHRHLVMTNYAIDILMEGQIIDQEKAQLFAERYQEAAAARAMKSPSLNQVHELSNHC
jgi:hypothetical protein